MLPPVSKWGLFPSLWDHDILRADKFRFKENNGSRLNPVNMGYRFLNIIDRLNEKIHLEESSVSIGIKTVKPR